MSAPANRAKALQSAEKVHAGAEKGVISEMGIPVDRDRSFRFVVTGDSGSS
jgi:hypothetical protein